MTGNKSTGTNQFIAPPSGGGAMKGIGEKFSADLHTGTGNFTIPIALPGGRHGFQPQISLSYSTGSGNSPFGLGWNITIPNITRKTSGGIPQYKDNSLFVEDWDTYILSGAEDLVPVALWSFSDPNKTGPQMPLKKIDHPTAEDFNRFNVVEFRPRTEGLFAYIYHHRYDKNDFWEVRTKDGLTSIYGTPNSKLNDSAVIADPNNREHVFSWNLTRTIDAFGNLIEYVYEHDQNSKSDDGVHQWDQNYLTEIRYVDYYKQGSFTNPQFLIKVKFVYEQRPDEFSEYRAGFEIRTIKRCIKIQVYSNIDDGDNNSTETLIQTFYIKYIDQQKLDDFNKQILPLNGLSLLHKVKVEGHDGQKSEMLAPIEVGYTLFNPKKRSFIPIKGDDMPPFSLANPNCELIDVVGNGLPDVLEMDGTIARYWRNLGNGKLDRPKQMKYAPLGLRLSDPQVQLIDANGDGRIDLLVSGGTSGNDLNPNALSTSKTSSISSGGGILQFSAMDRALSLSNGLGGISGYFSLQFGIGEWDSRLFHKFDFAPSFSLKDQEVRLLDLNGDGIIDAMRSANSGYLECFFNDSDKGWTETRLVKRKKLDDFPNVTFSDSRIKIADMSGDGLADIVMIYDGNVSYWPNLGWGNWGKRLQMYNCPRFPYNYDPKRILVGDVDGDGLADIVYVDDNKVVLWINQSGNGWSNPIVVSGTPSVSDIDSIRLADMLGNGISGVLWSFDYDGLRRNSMFFLDFTGGVKPYLLSEVNNHIGSITKINYETSTKFYLQDQNQNNDPQKRWKTSLPFPVQVVSNVEVIDAISGSKLTTKYRYHHGYWDGAEREFRGFGRTDHIDTEIFEEYNKTGLLHADSSSFNNVSKEFFSPPTETRTWFHQGPIGNEYGDWIEGDSFYSEYWIQDPQRLTRPKSMNDFLNSLMGSNRRIKRDALRSLRGRILRTELYALDGNTSLQERPYTVTEYLHGLMSVSSLLKKDTDNNFNRTVFSNTLNSSLENQLDGWSQKVFYPCILAERTTQWERGNDPLTQFKFIEDYDEYGQARSQISIAVPRGRDFSVFVKDDLRSAFIDTNDYINKINQFATTSALAHSLTTTTVTEPHLSTHTITNYAKRDDGFKYIVDRVSCISSYEIKNDGKPDVFSLKEAISNVNAKGTNSSSNNVSSKIIIDRSVIGQTLNFYDGLAYQGLPFGQIGDYGALTRTETLSLTDEILQKAYLNENDGSMSIPPYFSHDGSIKWTDDYPQGFRDLVSIKNPLDSTRPGLSISAIGYGYPSDTNSEYLKGYYVATQRQKYDFQNDGSNGIGKGTLLTSKDPLGNDGFISYDDFNLFPVQYTDSVGMVTNAVYNYRVLKPASIIEANKNRSYYTFSPLGLLKSISVMGKEGESDGDTIDIPGTVFEYNLNAFLENGYLFNWDNLILQSSSIDNLDKQRLIRFLKRNYLIDEDIPDDQIAVVKTVEDATSSRLSIIIKDLYLSFSLKLDNDNNRAILLADYNEDNKVVEKQIYQFTLKKEADVNNNIKLNLYGNIQPICVKTIKRIHHTNEKDVAVEDLDKTIDAVEFSDGFGRLVQTRTVAEDIIFGNQFFGDSSLPLDQNQNLNSNAAIGYKNKNKDLPNVVVSGWQAYDNKGNVVEKYEPFFSIGFGYGFPTESQFGKKIEMYYDPRGHVIRTVNPDKSEQTVVYGIPKDIANPLVYDPSPWESYTYDANDNSGRTHPSSSLSYQNHRNTPSSVLVDALGRKIKSVERNGSDQINDWYNTIYGYDIQGNVISITDALGRVAFKYVYDLYQKPNVLRDDSIDAGLKKTVVDSVGNIVEKRDSKGALILKSFDNLNRSTRLWARDNMNETVTLRELTVYGDDEIGTGMKHDQAAILNLLGKVYKHYDESGLISFIPDLTNLNSKPYDFKGNVLEKVRQVIKDDVILKVFDSGIPSNNWEIQPYRVNWLQLSMAKNDDTLEQIQKDLLDAFEYRSSLMYDALNRIIQMAYPQDVTKSRKKLYHSYNNAGYLENIKLDDSIYVKHFAYNAKGQRILVAYGNNTMTRYSYDPNTFRLSRMRTEKYNLGIDDGSGTVTYATTGQSNSVFQDYAYDYDIVGNILTIYDRTPNSGITNNPEGKDKLDKLFNYDPLYRLLSATGREFKYDFQNLPSPWSDTINNATSDLTISRGYIQEYLYDKMGNMQMLTHKSANIGEGGFTRKYSLMSNNNHLLKMEIGTASYDYSYDTNGDMVSETNLRHFEWDHSDHMRSFYVQTGNSEPSIYTHYLYDSAGQRVKKFVRKQGGQNIEVTVYNEAFDHCYIKNGSTVKENNELHIMNNKKRIAMLRIGNPFSDDITPAIKYHLSDHLDNSNVVLDDIGNLINREEYYPYGETSFGSFAKKKYRYTGKQRDEETGLYYYDLRYMCPWNCRWITCDPAGRVDGTNLYIFVRDNPVCFHDRNGNQSAPISSVTGVDFGKLAEQIRDQANNLLRTMGSGSTSHALTRGTFEASIAEAQGAELVGPSGETFSHIQNLKNALTSINRQQGEIRQLLDMLRRLGPDGAKATEALSKSLRPLLERSQELVQLGEKTEEILKEIESTGNVNRLQGVPLNTGRDAAGLVSNQLQNLRLSLLPNAIRQPEWVSKTLEQIRQLPTTLAEVRGRAEQLATSIGASISAYATAGRTAASRAGTSLINFFGRAMPYLEAIGAEGSRLISIPLIIIPTVQNGRPSGMSFDNVPLA